MTDQNGKIVKKSTLALQVRDLVESAKGAIQAALPRHLAAERMLRVARTAIQQTPDLMSCDRGSLIGALVEASQLGLEVGMLGQAYLVPYGKRAQLIIGYRGMLALARRSGDIVSIDAHVVHENDKFEASYGTDGRLHHEQCLTGDPGKVICAYAYARLKDGGYAYDVLPLSELERIRRSSAAASSGPWKSWPEEMMRKSAVKRLCKYLPLSVELAEILLRDGRHEAGLAPEIDIEATVAEEPKTKIEQITERLNSETETVINVEATKQNIPGAETQVVSTDILVRCKKHNDVDAENGCWKCAAEKEEQAEGEKAKKAQARPKQSKLDVD